jgi:glycosyltransferase involved in cell wall biosynthesis
MYQPLISICIPAYKQAQHVERALISIAKQTYKHVEIVVSDDSPDEGVKLITDAYINQLDIKYYHNVPALKSPANWNAALDKASGELLMLLHHDDWLNKQDTLVSYVRAFEEHPDVDFVFSKNTGVDKSGKEYVLQAIPKLLHELEEKPDHLLLAQVIGPPSNTMLRASIDVRYDEKYIWLVDVDYYNRILKKDYKSFYIDKHLMNIGLHEEQTTTFVRENDSIILKENIWFAGKLGNAAFKDVLIYDYYWRLLRNHNVRSIDSIIKSGVKRNEILEVILHMLKLQKKIPVKILKNGFISKPLMFINYLLQ